MAAANYFDSVQKLYIAFYQRPADSGGLLYWSQRLDAAKGSLEGVVDAFATSAEANTLYGAVDKNTVGTVVDKIYQALFNRTPDEAGKKYYVDGFLAGKFTAGKIALDVLNGATNNDLVVINNKVTVANRFTETVDGRAITDSDFGVGTVFAATYAGDTDAQAAREILVGVTSNPATMLTASDVAAQVQSKIADQGDAVAGQTSGKTFTLTTSIDNLTGTGGNDTFTGVLNAAGVTTGADGTSLNAADILNGAGGVDKLSYIVLGDAAGKGASSLNPLNVTNVEQFEVRNLATDSGTNPVGEEVHTLNLANVTGVTGVTNKGSSAGVNFQNIGKNASVTVDGVTAGNTTFTRGTTAITEALTINIANGVKAGDIQSVDTNNDATSVVINSTGGKNVVGAVEVTGSGGANHTATSVTINAASDLTIGAAGGGADLTGFDTTKAGTITVTGAGKVVLNDLAGVVKTLNAADSAGGVTATGAAALQQVTGGAGKDSITLGGDLNDKGSVKLGAGNDTLNIAANAVKAGAMVDLGDGDDTFVGTGAVSKDAIVDGGAGKDTLAADVVNAVNIGAFKNFEYLDLKGLNVAGGLDADLFAAQNTIEKLVLSGDAGTNGIISNVGASVGLEILASSTNGVTINQKGTNATSAAVDKFTATFNAEADPLGAAKTVTVSALTLNEIEEITLVSDGGAKVSNVLTLLAGNQVKTVTITGDNAFALNGVTATTLKTVDASGQTAGGLKMSLGAVTGELTVKLGAGDDVITAGINSTGGSLSAVSTATALDKIANFDKATDAELTDSKGYDLIQLADANGTPVNFAVTANATGTTTAAGINNGVINFGALTSGPQNFAEAITVVDAAVTTAGNAAVFQYGSNSYLFVENGTADLVIELTGVTGVTKLGEIGTTDSFYVM